MTNLLDYDRLFETISELVFCHSPSGVEGEIDRVLLDRFPQFGLETWQDEAGNVIAKIPGQDDTRSIAITGHKDEIGAIVKTIDRDGKVRIRNLGGSFPWVYGEGVVDLLGDRGTIPGILSFGSRHVSHESQQKMLQIDAPLTWDRVWVETGLTHQELTAAGIRPGTRVVVGKHRKSPLRMGDRIASYTLDNKASVAILLALAESIDRPFANVYLVASAKEEVGAIGALYFTNRTHLDALIALEIAPIAPEFPIADSVDPVLLSQDKYSIYDEGLNAEIHRAANAAGVPIQWAAIAGFGSDASLAIQLGHTARGACLGFPTQNTHGYEIAHLGAIANCIRILQAYCEPPGKG